MERFRPHLPSVAGASATISARLGMTQQVGKNIAQGEALMI